MSSLKVCSCCKLEKDPYDFSGNQRKKAAAVRCCSDCQSKLRGGKSTIRTADDFAAMTQNCSLCHGCGHIPVVSGAAASSKAVAGAAAAAAAATAVANSDANKEKPPSVDALAPTAQQCGLCHGTGRTLACDKCSGSGVIPCAAAGSAEEGGRACDGCAGRGDKSVPAKQIPYHILEHHVWTPPPPPSGLVASFRKNSAVYDALSSTTRRALRSYAGELDQLTRSVEGPNGETRGKYGPVYPLPAGATVADVNLFGYVLSGKDSAEERRYFFGEKASSESQEVLDTPIALPLGVKDKDAARLGFEPCCWTSTALPQTKTDEFPEGIPVFDAYTSGCVNFVHKSVAAASRGGCYRCWMKSIDEERKRREALAEKQKQRAKLFERLEKEGGGHCEEIPASEVTTNSAEYYCLVSLNRWPDNIKSFEGKKGPVSKALPSADQIKSAKVETDKTCPRCLTKGMAEMEECEEDASDCGNTQLYTYTFACRGKCLEEGKIFFLKTLAGAYIGDYY